MPSKLNNAAKYRHQILIGRAERKRDAAGQVQYIYPTKTTWAEVVEVAGEEKPEAGGATQTITTRVSMRWRDDVTAKDRIYHNGRELGIVWFGDRSGLRRELVCDCFEVKQ